MQLLFYVFFGDFFCILCAFYGSSRHNLQPVGQLMAWQPPFTDCGSINGLSATICSLWVKNRPQPAKNGQKLPKTAHNSQNMSPPKS